MQIFINPETNWTQQINTSARFLWWEKTLSGTILFAFVPISVRHHQTCHEPLLFSAIFRLSLLHSYGGMFKIPCFGSCLSILLADLFKKICWCYSGPLAVKRLFHADQRVAFSGLVSLSRGKADRICLGHLLLSKYVGEHWVENPDKGFQFFLRAWHELCQTQVCTHTVLHLPKTVILNVILFGGWLWNWI